MPLNKETKPNLHRQWSNLEKYLEQFSVQYNCLKLTKHETDNCITFTGFVNHEYE